MCYVIGDVSMAKKKTYKKTKKTINTSPKNQKIVTKKKKGNKKYKRYISNSNNTIKKHNSVKNNDVTKMFQNQQKTK